MVENEATGEITVLFADIRSALGVDNVNLIWRHLATIPEALPWAWGVLRPLYVTGAIGEAASALRAAMELPALPRLPPETFMSVGLLADDMAAIRTVLAAYDRTNAMALIAMSVLLISLDGRDRVGALESPGVRRPPQSQTILTLPRLLALAEMAPATASLVETLNRLGAADETPIMASMYRHLAHWPPYLALAWSIVAPVAADGRLHGLISAAVGRARIHGGELAARLQPSDRTIRPNTRADLRRAVERFRDDVIGKMVVICALLQNVSAQREW